ncbi:MAG: DNA repair protein RadA [Syntrophales bacterium]|nr:DNA repair protein RadA [Syntrophales bacterium]HOG08390.1 DNA repair protein RadA [Syntrophales bacterium]HPB70342.1 DNA repair protein RadA [Syntrophales bacterium]HQN26624.1 DNA repair protein RadA [Syntrophales bacterium]HQP28446.1 DNA repair protein RadA [Syntrophales bacterium]
MKKIKTSFFCQSCGHASTKWLGKCPSCGGWNQFVEEEIREASEGPSSDLQLHEAPRPIADIVADEKERLATGLAEMDRVLGGGVVPGSAVLVGGDPGIGKSTLLLQVCQRLAERGLKVLYCSGEESARQIKLRGKRIGADSDQLLVFVEIALENILAEIRRIEPHAVVIDSIQTVYASNLSSAPGSVGQVREASERLILHAKKTGIPVFLVGHVTKDGSLAGPKVLEHMVDTVLYFEGDSGHAYRIVRGIKNRFGPTNEIGVFEMRDDGLKEVANPSALFLSERPEKAAGSVVVPSLEGTRPILVEIQSLVIPTSFGMPRRTTIGVDHNRVSLLVAVMDKVCGLHLSGHDIFINVAGGVKVDEPAVDLGLVASMASSFLDRPVAPGTVVFGEVGLTGEVRGISQMETRLKEAARMGFTRCILPAGTPAGRRPESGIEMFGIRSLKDLLDPLF